MSKYIIELDDRIKLVTSVGVTENGIVYTTSDYVHNLEELNYDYINEHYGELQDEAYQRGFEDGRWKAEDGCTGCKYEGNTGEHLPCEYCMNNFKNQWTAKQTDRIEVGDEVTFLPNDRRGIVTACHVPDVYAENDKYAVFCGTTVEYVLRQHITKTGKHYDIQSILEAMRK